MNDRDTTTTFAAYRRALVGAVKPPGVEVVHRAVLRRQRRRASVATVAALLLAVIALSQFAVGRAGDPVPAGPPTPGPSTTKTPLAGPPYQIVDGPELHVVSPATAALRPADGRYRGVVDIDVHNSGRRPYTYVRLYLTFPEGVRWDSPPDGYPTLGGCGGSPAQLVCGVTPIPAGGGRVRLPFPLIADIAPGPEPDPTGGNAIASVDGFTVRVVGADANGVEIADRTPEDNRVDVRLLLYPA